MKKNISAVFQLYVNNSNIELSELITLDTHTQQQLNSFIDLHYATGTSAELMTFVSNDKAHKVYALFKAIQQAQD